MPITVFFYSLEFKFRHAEYLVMSTRITSNLKVNFAQVCFNIVAGNIYIIRAYKIHTKVLDREYLSPIYLSLSVFCQMYVEELLH